MKKINPKGKSVPTGCREIWNRCDVCGRFISHNAFDCGFAVRKMVTPDSAYSGEDYETLCEQHRES